MRDARALYACFADDMVDLHVYGKACWRQRLRMSWGLVAVSMVFDEVAPDVPPETQRTRRNTLEGGSLAKRSARRC